MDPSTISMLVPTWKGHVETTRDALLIFEACYNGTLPFCSRCPCFHEREKLIISGNIFVVEPEAGFQRWTDGIPWSPSRTLTNFLIYRQLDDPLQQSEKKIVKKRGGRLPIVNEPNPSSASISRTDKNASRSFPDLLGVQIKGKDSRVRTSNRGLVGSLVDSYDFKENGLLKRTIIVTIDNKPCHMVAYYSINDAEYHLQKPRDDPRLRDLWIRESLLIQRRFSFGLDDIGEGTSRVVGTSHSLHPDDGHTFYRHLLTQLAPPYSAYKAQYSPPFLYCSTYMPGHREQFSRPDINFALPLHFPSRSLPTWDNGVQVRDPDLEDQRGLR